MSKLVRVPADSPDRCQAGTGSGQCPYKKSEGSAYCIMHGGVAVEKQKIAAEMRNYRLVKNTEKERLSEQYRTSSLKSLREEVILARMLLEEIWNKCSANDQLLIHSSRISDMLTRIQNLVVACNRLEEKTGKVLDKTELLIIGEQIVGIIGESIDDPDVLHDIALKISELLYSKVE